MKRVDYKPWQVPSPEATFSSSENTITLTGKGYTLRWPAPELLLEDDLSLAADMWAFGWVASEVHQIFMSLSPGAHKLVPK